MRGEQEVEDRLSPKAKIAWRLLRRGDAVSIDDLFLAVYPTRSRIKSQTMRQRYVGAIISPINKIIGYYDQRILPGTPRGTYQLKPTE